MTEDRRYHHELLIPDAVHPAGFVQPDDPGPKGPFKVWYDTSGLPDEPIIQWVRDATNTTWLPVGTQTGPTGRSAYQTAVDAGFIGTEAQWLASLKGDVGNSVYEQAVEEGFVGTFEAFLETIRGPTGLSAYQIALAQGFVGTIQEWIESLEGDPGPPGAPGSGGGSGDASYISLYKFTAV